MKPNALEIVLALVVVVPIALVVSISLLATAYDVAKRWKEWVALPAALGLVGAGVVAIRWAFGILSNL